MQSNVVFAFFSLSILEIRVWKRKYKLCVHWFYPTHSEQVNKNNVYQIRMFPVKVGHMTVLFTEVIYALC